MLSSFGSPYIDIVVGEELGEDDEERVAPAQAVGRMKVEVRVVRRRTQSRVRRRLDRFCRNCRRQYAGENGVERVEEKDRV